MTRGQRRVLKQRVRTNIQWRKQELRKLVGLGTRYHFRTNQYFKQAVSNLKKEIRLFNRLSHGIK